MRVAIEQKNGGRFLGRELRIKKAVAPKRLEKKAMRKEERAKKVEQTKQENIEKRELKEELDKEDDEVLKLRNFDAAIDSGDDSEGGDDRKPTPEDDKEAERKRIRKERKLARKSRRIQKEKQEGDALEAHIAKIHVKSDAATKKREDDGPNFANKLAFNKKTTVKIMKEKIESVEKKGTSDSKYEDRENKKQFGKDQPRVRDILKQRIEKKKNKNLTKIKKIKIKTTKA